MILQEENISGIKSEQHCKSENIVVHFPCMHIYLEKKQKRNDHIIISILSSMMLNSSYSINVVEII